MKCRLTVGVRHVVKCPSKALGTIEAIFKFSMRRSEPWHICDWMEQDSCIQHPTTSHDLGCFGSWDVCLSTCALCCTGPRNCGGSVCSPRKLSWKFLGRISRWDFGHGSSGLEMFDGCVKGKNQRVTMCKWLQLGPKKSFPRFKWNVFSGAGIWKLRILAAFSQVCFLHQIGLMVLLEKAQHFFRFRILRLKPHFFRCIWARSWFMNSALSPMSCTFNIYFNSFRASCRIAWPWNSQRWT